jgi:hypothetical protein
MSQNFEELYNKLKEEYESSKKDNDELCKEYESTIEMLSESVEAFKKEKEILEQKLSKLEQDQKNFKKEKESLLSKNKDKIVDIQNLNKQNDRLSNEVKRLKEEKTLFDSKIVTLENDNEHYQNKIREYEALAEDLENQLESALEENITLQTEFETYKQTIGDQLIRKDEELRDFKNDCINKEKFIQRLQRGNNALLVKNLQKNFKEGGSLQQKRRFTLGGGNNDLLSFQRTLASRGLLGSNDDLVNDKSDKNRIRETKTFSNINNINNRLKARNSLFSPGFGSLAKLVKQKEEIKKGLGDNGTGKKESKFLTQMREKSNKSLASNKSFLTDKKLADEQIDEKSENSEISNNEKEFTDLKICQEKSFDYISIANNNNNNNNTSNISNGAMPQFRVLGNEKAIIDNLQKLLERVRKRKTKLIDKKETKEKKKKNQN